MAVLSTDEILACKILTAHEQIAPKTIKQAMNSPESERWQAAIDSENQSLFTNNTLTVMRRRTIQARVLPMNGIFKVKANADGSVERFKFRWTVMGNLQREGIDFKETFAPVSRNSTVRTIFAMAASSGHIIHQRDVDTAFLYGEMPKEEAPVYVALPMGYTVPKHLQHVPAHELACRVDKALYGLRQSSRLWNKSIDSTMKSLDFKASKFDPCLYIRGEGLSRMFVAIHVDDLIISGPDEATITVFKKQLAQRYNMKDLGLLKYCLVCGNTATSRPPARESGQVHPRHPSQIWHADSRADGCAHGAQAQTHK